MKKRILIATITSLLTAAPQLTVDQPIFDFGTIQEGNRTIEHAFKITNTGDETLKIQKVKPGCSCTVVKFDDELEPGESSEIVAGLKINGRTGKQSKPITIVSNAENSPIFKLSMKAFIMGAINMDRRYGIFQYLKKGQTITDSLTLISTKKDLKIISAYYTQRGKEKPVEVPVETTLKKGKTKKDEAASYNLAFSFKPEMTHSQAGTIYFTTNHPDKPSIEFRCMIEVKDLKKDKSEKSNK